MPTAPNPREPEIQQELGENTQLATHLLEDLNRLGARLDHILRAEVPEGKTTAELKRSSTSTLIGGRLRENNEILKQVGNLLENILIRLEI